MIASASLLCRAGEGVSSEVLSALIAYAMDLAQTPTRGGASGAASGDTPARDTSAPALGDTPARDDTFIPAGGNASAPAPQDNAVLSALREYPACTRPGDPAYEALCVLASFADKPVRRECVLLPWNSVRTLL